MYCPSEHRYTVYSYLAEMGGAEEPQWTEEEIDLIKKGAVVTVQFRSVRVLEWLELLT